MNAVLQTLPLEQLLPSTTHAQSMRRKSFNKDALGELAASIKQHGVLQPIVVRLRSAENVGDVTIGEHFEIVAGERRWRAAQLAGLQAVPVNLLELSDEQVIEIQLIENLQREDVHPMLEAEGYHELVHTYGHPIEDVYSKVGKSRSYVYGRMKLLALSKKAREAFYGNEITASIANLIARIPVEKLQDEALEAVLGFPHAKESYRRRDPMSFRDAAAHINEHFMLDLAQAAFPVADEKLNGAPACGKCPKNTSNSPDLFGDVKGGLCTDTVCFAGKIRAFGQRQLEAAKTSGAHTITGNAAKKIAPANDYGGLREGYYELDKERWIGNVHTTARKLLKPDAATALLQLPGGQVVEVVHESQLKKPKREASSGESKWQKERKDQAAAAKRQTALRRAIFRALVEKAKWQAPSMRVLAELAAENMDYDAGAALMDALEVPEPKSRGYRDRVVEHVKSLKTEEQLETFVAQAYLAGELHVNSYALSSELPRLEAAAKAAGVDVAKIRRELAPKKKPVAKKKPKAKKSGKR